MIRLIHRQPQYDCQVNSRFFSINSSRRFYNAIHLGAFIMHASSLSIFSKPFITDITLSLSVLDFTLLILRSVYAIKIILMRKIPSHPKNYLLL